MGQVSKSTANNIYVNEGNQLVLYVDAETGALMLKDFNGVTQPVSDYIGGASGNFIKNQTTLQEDANFNISGRGSFGGSLGTENLNVKGKIDLIDEFFNIVIGNAAFSSNVTGENNIAIGKNALQSNQQSNDNIAIGLDTLKNNIGDANIALGNLCLSENTLGSYNLAIGYSNLTLNTSGSFNVAVGSGILLNNTEGSSNTGLGYSVLENNTIGENNIGIGTGSLNVNTTGKENIGIGSFSLFDNTIGERNISLGKRTQSKNFNNCILIGNDAIAKADNEFVLGSAANAIGNVVADAAFTSDFKMQINLNGVMYYIPLKQII